MAAATPRTRSLALQIVCKPTAAVVPTFVDALLHSLRLDLAVVVEPKLFSLFVFQLLRLTGALQSLCAGVHEGSGNVHAAAASCGADAPADIRRSALLPVEVDGSNVLLQGNSAQYVAQQHGGVDDSARGVVDVQGEGGDGVQDAPQEARGRFGSAIDLEQLDRASSRQQSRELLSQALTHGSAVDAHAAAATAWQLARRSAGAGQVSTDGSSSPDDSLSIKLPARASPSSQTHQSLQGAQQGHDAAPDASARARGSAHGQQPLRTGDADSHSNLAWRQRQLRLLAQLPGMAQLRGQAGGLSASDTMLGRKEVRAFVELSPLVLLCLACL